METMTRFPEKDDFELWNVCMERYRNSVWENNEVIMTDKNVKN